MKWVPLLLISISILVPVEGARNVTQTTVYLQEGPIIIKFINMGVDAYWGAHILENAAAALPIIEDLIGIPLPSVIETVEIYGRKTLDTEEWAVGYNDGHTVTLEKDHPNPIIIFHELVHFWTIHYNVPWPLVEGYCDVYADLCAIELGLHEVTYQKRNWEQEYLLLQENSYRVPLNNFNYLSENVSEESIDYFYHASTVVVYQVYEMVGATELQEINQLMAAYPTDGKVGGIGIVQYMKLTKEATGINYARLFMPTIVTNWTDADVKQLQESVERYCSVQELIGATDSHEQLRTALVALVNGNFSQFKTIEQTMVTQYYTELAKGETELPEQEIIYPEEETGIFQNRLFLIGIVMLVVVVILLVIILRKIVGEEEEILEWEAKGPSQDFWKTPTPEPGFLSKTEEAREGEFGLDEEGDLDELSELRGISELDILGTTTSKGLEEMKDLESMNEMKDLESMEDLEDLEELPEIPDIEELTK